MEKHEAHRPSNLLIVALGLTIAGALTGYYVGANDAWELGRLTGRAENTIHSAGKVFLHNGRPE